MRTPQQDLIASGGLAAIFTPLTTTEALDHLRRRYGTMAAARKLATEKDDTFLVTTDDGARRIAKFSNPDETADEIALQCAALDFIAAQDPTLPVPRVIRDSDGAMIATLTDSHGQRRLLRVLTYLDGRLLDECDTTAPDRRQIGRMAARLRRALEGFSHPGDSRALAWDVRRLPDLGGMLHAIPDPHQRKLLQGALDRFGAISPELSALRTQVLHNDMTRPNILVDPAAAQFVTGIIDFGDIVRTAIVVDASTAMIDHLLPGGDRMMLPVRDVLDGYLELADLSQRELALLPHLFMGRIVARVLIAAWRVEQHPGNADYITRRIKHSWLQLAEFMGQPAETLSRAFTR